MYELRGAHMPLIYMKYRALCATLYELTGVF